MLGLNKKVKQEVDNLVELTDNDAKKIVATGYYDDFQSNRINSGVKIQGMKEIIDKIHLK